MRTVAANRNDLIAAALAEEGIEVVRNIRDSNLLKFAPKARDCWYTKPSHADLETCDSPENKIAEFADGGNYYLLALNPDTLQWDFSPAVGNLADANNDDYLLRSDIATVENPECGSGVDPAICSVHTGLYFAPSPGFESRGGISPFFRKVEVYYVDVDGDGTKDPAAQVFSIVQYRAASGVREISRSIILTNSPL